MKYIILKKQNGDGCDYTIGCGMRYDIVEAESIEDCIEMVAYPEGRDGNYAFKDDNESIIEAWIILFEHAQKIDIDRLAEENDEREEEADALEHEKKERNEYERLKNKYGE